MCIRDRADADHFAGHDFADLGVEQGALGQRHLAHVVTLADDADQAPTGEHHQRTDALLGKDTQTVEQRILTVDAVNVGVGLTANNFCLLYTSRCV